MLFGIEKKVGWMDWYIIYKITILPFKKLEGSIKLEDIFVFALHSLSLLSHPPIIGRIHFGGPGWIISPSSSPLLPLIPPTKQGIGALPPTLSLPPFLPLTKHSVKV